MGIPALSLPWSWQTMACATSSPGLLAVVSLGSAYLYALISWSAASQVTYRAERLSQSPVTREGSFPEVLVLSTLCGQVTSPVQTVVPSVSYYLAMASAHRWVGQGCLGSLLTGRALS